MMKYILQMVEIDLKDNIPESVLTGVKFLFGVGGGDDKKNSSSWILKKWNHKDRKILG